jgi:hypothetical protein
MTILNSDTEKPVMRSHVKVVLFSVAHFDTLYHYTSETLPILGDTIELESGRTFFNITETFTLPAMKDDYTVAYILCGTLLGKELSPSNFKNLKHRIHHTANLDVELNSYGIIIFPDSLD